MSLINKNTSTSNYFSTTAKFLMGILLCFSLSIMLISCSYLKYASIQAEYSRIQDAEPGQVNLKHMLERDRYFVFGKIVDSFSKYSETPLAIAAYSSKFIQNERVDIMYFAGPGTHYGLNLPEGSFSLIVLADKNSDNIFDPAEVVGLREITLSKNSAPEKVMERIDIPIGLTMEIDSIEAIPVPEMKKPVKSINFPPGTIRQLDDHIFDEGIATLGMYDPASFLENAPTMFYALEENLSYKIPVVFVHGIGGTSRSFVPIIQRLDRTRYKPWFFYYPSGGDLDQLAEFFYRIFISGRVIPLGGMPMVVIAHSMGGLVVREALNKYKDQKGENKVELFVTIASPLGGHPAAAAGEEHGLIVLPAWRDVNPNSRFIKNLYRKPLPEFVNHHLIYAFHNSDTVKLSDNSDGVVPLASQLHAVAQNQSSAQFGFNSTHTSILENEDMINYVIDRLSGVKNIYPESHLDLFDEGGFDIDLSEKYSPVARYIIHYLGRYVVALSNGKIEPLFPYQTRFLNVVRGEAEPSTEFEKSWMKFRNDYPEIHQ